jgi:hypothetical protein
MAVVAADPEHRGLVPPLSPVRRSVTLENRGDSDVAIEVASKTCGCLDVSLDRLSMAPGERASVVVGVFSLPEPGLQRHAATIRARWSDGDVERSERIEVRLSYASDVELVVMPKAAAVAIVEGERGHFDVYVRAAEEGAKPGLAIGACSLPGWTVRLVRDDKLKPDVQRWRVSGPSAGVGYHDGAVTLFHEGADQPAVTVPVRVRVLSAYRAVPGGAAFALPGDDRGEGQVCVLNLFPRSSTLPVPARVELDAEGVGVEATLAQGEQGFSVLVRLREDPHRPSIGSCRARVLDADARVLLDFPIVWYARAAPLPPAGR